MNCKHGAESDVAERYLNRRLAESEQDEFETHLLECPECLQRVEFLQNLRDAISEQPVEIAALRTGNKRILWWAATAAVAATVLIAVGLISVWRADKSDRTPSGSVAQRQRVPQPQPTSTQASTSSSTTPPSTVAARDDRQAAPKSEAVRQHEAASGQQTETASRESVPGTGAPPQQVTTSPGHKPEPPVVATEEQAAELYHLAAVNPPPYSLRGVSGTGELSGSGGAGSSYAKGGRTGQAAFEKAMLAYVDGRYGEAAELLEGASQASAHPPEVDFYLGICRLVNGHPAEAVGPLRTAAAKESLLSQSAHFYLAKAYLQLGKLNDAEGELNAAATMPGRLKTEAGNLLTRLRAMKGH